MSTLGNISSHGVRFLFATRNIYIFFSTFYFYFIFLTYFIEKLVFISFNCKLWLIFTFDQLEMNNK